MPNKTNKATRRTTGTESQESRDERRAKRKYETDLSDSEMAAERDKEKD